MSVADLSGTTAFTTPGFAHTTGYASAFGNFSSPGKAPFCEREIIPKKLWQIISETDTLYWSAFDNAYRRRCGCNRIESETRLR
jgi:hypothetical protein